MTYIIAIQEDLKFIELTSWAVDETAHCLNTRLSRHTFITCVCVCIYIYIYIQGGARFF